MTTIKTYNCQDYKEYMVYPSETCFVSTETDLRQVAYYHLSKDIEENIAVLKRLKEVDLKNTTLIETKVGEKLLYLIVSDELTQKDIPHLEESIKKDYEKDIENMPTEYKESKIHKLQKHFLEELNGLTTYEAKVILEKVQSVISDTSIVIFK